MNIDANHERALPHDAFERVPGLVESTGMTQTGTKARKPRVPLKTVALPNEHGAWALVLEPVLLALLVAPSVAGAVLALAGLAAMLAQHPLSLWLTDIRRGKMYPRSVIAGRFTGVYGSIGLAAAIGALALSDGPAFFLPAMFAAPLVLIQLEYDTRNAGRKLLPELAGAGAVGALAATGGAVIVAAGLALTGALPAGVLLGTVLLACRAAWGLSRFRRATKPWHVGMRELAFGLAYVLLAAAGYA